MKLIYLLLRSSRTRFAWAVLAGLLSGACSAGLIALINVTLAQQNAPKVPLAIGFIGLCLLLLLTSATSQAMVNRLAQQLIFDLRMGLTQRILACPLRHLEQVGASKLLATLTDDVEVISFASFFVSILCVNVALLVGCLVYLSWLSLPVFLSLSGYMALGVVINQVLLNRGRRFLALARHEQDRLVGHFRTTTEGTKELKLHAARRYAFLNEDLKGSALASRQYRIQAGDLFAIAGSSGLVLLFIPIGLILFVAPALFQLPITVLAGYALTIIFMITPLRGILSTLPELNRASVALNKIESLGLSLVDQTTEATDQDSHTSESKWHTLELAGITHAYRGERETDQFVLGPIHLTFTPGELVFIVGGNGSGKSTLVKLIAGLYTPESGSIRVDAQLITDANREWYRQQFSVVFADFYLFDRLLGLNAADLDTQAQHYLAQLRLDHKLKVQAGQFSTTNLSQGQRKRLALLTAYLDDRPVYIFDEWASDQDPVFKNIFYTQLLPDLKRRGKIVLAISHDDHYFNQADRIIKLDYGQLEYDKQR
jgi:putative ATP-binding cassette transporter